MGHRRTSERTGVEGTTEKTATWHDILNMVKRLDSDEIPGARLRAHFQEKHWETTTDEEGYFVFNLDLEEPLGPGWHEVKIELMESVGEPEKRFVCEQVLIPHPGAEFAVISDLDDTVIKSHSAEFFQKAAIAFGDSAKDRVAFPGVPAFYRALSRGPDDQGRNPMFYVSRSGWNLYDLFEEFMEVNEIPAGPLFLADLRITEEKSAVMGHDRHKFESIDLLVRTDPELYEEVISKHPGRIRAIYIHDVSPPERGREVRRVADTIEARQIPMLRAEDTLPLAEHAAERGYISRNALEEIRREVERQKGE